MSEILLILVPSIVIIISLALILTIICMCKCNKRYDNGHKPITHPGRHGQQLEMGSMGVKMPIRAPEYPMSQIRFIQELGEGTFGKVTFLRF